MSWFTRVGAVPGKTRVYSEIKFAHTMLSIITVVRFKPGILLGLLL